MVLLPQNTATAGENSLLFVQLLEEACLEELHLVWGSFPYQGKGERMMTEIVLISRYMS